MQLNQLLSWSVGKWLSFCHECRCKSQNKANHKGSIDHQDQYILITVHIHNLLSIVLGEPVTSRSKKRISKGKARRGRHPSTFLGLLMWWIMVKIYPPGLGTWTKPIDSEVGQFPGHSILRRRVFTVKNIVNSGVLLANMLITVILSILPWSFRHLLFGNIRDIEIQYLYKSLSLSICTYKKQCPIMPIYQYVTKSYICKHDSNISHMCKKMKMSEQIYTVNLYMYTSNLR